MFTTRRDPYSLFCITNSISLIIRPLSSLSLLFSSLRLFLLFFSLPLLHPQLLPSSSFSSFINPILARLLYTFLHPLLFFPLLHSSFLLSSLLPPWIFFSLSSFAVLPADSPFSLLSPPSIATTNLHTRHPLLSLLLFFRFLSILSSFRRHHRIH